MSIEQPIYFSVTGKGEHREFYADNVTDTKEEMRQRAISLWYDLRKRQAAAGFKPSAAVWIGQIRCQPTSEEIAAHEEKTAEILALDAFHKESAGADDDPLDVADDEEQEDELDLAPVSHKPEPEEPTDPQGIVLDDDDDLDF